MATSLQPLPGEGGETTAIRSILFEPAAPVSVLPPLANSLAGDPPLQRMSCHLHQFVARDGAGIANLVGQDRIKKAQPVAARARVRPLLGLLDGGGFRSTQDAEAHTSTGERSAVFSRLSSTLAIHAGDRSRFGLSTTRSLARAMFALSFTPPPATPHRDHPKNDETRLNKRVPASSGGRIRTCDLRVMSPTSYQTAPPRVAPDVLAKSRLGLKPWASPPFNLAAPAHHCATGYDPARCEPRSWTLARTRRVCS